MDVRGTSQAGSRGFATVPRPGWDFGRWGLQRGWQTGQMPGSRLDETQVQFPGHWEALEVRKPAEGRGEVGGHGVAREEWSEAGSLWCEAADRHHIFSLSFTIFLASYNGGPFPFPFHLVHVTTAWRTGVGNEEQKSFVTCQGPMASREPSWCESPALPPQKPSLLKMSQRVLGAQRSHRVTARAAIQAGCHRGPHGWPP